MLMSKLKSWKTVAVVGLLIIGILSAAVFSPWLSSPKAHPETLETLDRQKMKAMTMSVVVTAASTALTLLPDDTGTSVADEMDDLSMPLFIIVCLIYMEKFLLTTFSWLSFSFMIPGVCLLGILFVFTQKEIFFSWARKILILAVALFMLIPISATVTNKIEETFSETVSMTFDKAYQLAEETNTDEEKNGFVAFFSKLADNVVVLVEKAKDMLSIMVDAVAVLLITSCIIPILTAIIFLWIVKTVVNVNIPVKSFALLVRPKRVGGFLAKARQRVEEQSKIEEKRLEE